MRYTISAVALAISFVLPLGAGALTPLPPEVEINRLGWSVLPGYVVSDEYGSAVTIGESIYVISYWQDPKRLLSRYTPSTFTWERVVEVPHDKFQGTVALAAVDGQLFVVSDENLMQYDAEAKSFKQLARQLPAHRNSQDYAVAGAAGRLLVIGGTANVSGSYVRIATVDAYSLATDQWSSGPSLPQALEGIHATAVGETIYVVGSPERQPGKTVAYVLAPGATAWSLVVEFDGPGLLETVAVRGNLLTFIYADEVREYDVVGGIWTSATGPFCDIFNRRPLLDPRHSGVDYVTATVGDNVYLFGGYFNSRFPRSCYGADEIQFLGGAIFTFGPDRDNDHLLDSHELTLGSDPDRPDSDGDGYLDYQEVLANYSPTTPSRSVNRAAVNASRGKVLLDVEGRGQLWYVDPFTGRRYAISRGDDISAAARTLGRGISERDAAALPGSATARSLAGSFFIHTELRGAISYLNPRTLKLEQLTADAAGIQALARIATGIRQRDLEGIPAGAQAYLRFMPQMRDYIKSKAEFSAAVARVCAPVDIARQSCVSTDLEAALWRFFVEESGKQ